MRLIIFFLAIFEVAIAVSSPYPEINSSDFFLLTPVVPSDAVLVDGKILNGYVEFEIEVGADGNVASYQVISYSAEELISVAEPAISMWKFKPRVVDGMAVIVQGVKYRMVFSGDGTIGYE